MKTNTKKKMRQMSLQELNNRYNYMKSKLDELLDSLKLELLLLEDSDDNDESLDDE